VGILQLQVVSGAQWEVNALYLLGLIETFDNYNIEEKPF